MISVVLLTELAKVKPYAFFSAKGWFEWKKWNIIKHKSLLSHTKMGKEIIMFGDTEVQKYKFFKWCRYW